MKKVFNKSSKIYIAGHNGMVGSSILRVLKNYGYKNIIVRSKTQLNLLDQNKTYNFLSRNKPDVVIVAAAKVGGILANNTYRADFLFENLQIQNNLIHGSYLAGVKKLVFLGSSCIYPKICKQPIKENYLLTGLLESTNEPYAIAKIAGLKLIENYNKQHSLDFICLMPCNLFGPKDNYDYKNSHFIPALIKKIYEAKISNSKKIKIWGDGSPKREIMHVDDLALAVMHFLNKQINESFINVGSGFELRIKDYAKLISDIIGFKCDLIFDKSKPNGTPQKILDSSLANKYGWYSKIDIKKGLLQTYKNFLQEYEN